MDPGFLPVSHVREEISSDSWDDNNSNAIATENAASCDILTEENQADCIPYLQSKRSRAIRKDRKNKRNSGKCYVTETVKEIPEKYCREQLTECRMKCQNKFGYELRKTLFESFWGMNNRDRRIDYLNGLISTHPKVTQRLRSNSLGPKKSSVITQVQFENRWGTTTDL